MNKNISKKFDLFNEIKFINKNEKTKPFILKDIQNRFNTRLYKEFSPQPLKVKNKLSHIYNFSSTSTSSKTNVTEKEIPSNKIMHYTLKNNKINFDNKINDTESEKKISHTLNFISNTIENSTPSKHRRTNSYALKLNKKIKFIDNSNKTPQKYSYNKTLTNSGKKNLLNYFSFFSNKIKLEDILFIFQRIDAIIKRINNYNNIYDGGVSQECFEYWNFYFNSSLPEQYTTYFSNVHHVIVQSSNNLELFTIILSYHLSLNSKTYLPYKIMLKEIFPFIKKNFILIIRKIINEINEKEDRKYFLINEVYLKKINQILKEYCDEEISEKEIISNIIDNSKTSTEYIKIILTQYQTENKVIGKELTILFNNISKLPNVAINEFFCDKILHIIDKEGSITNISKLNNIQISNNNIKEPYITTPSKKKYSLVIDLDETLVFVKFINNNSNKALLHLRPYLFDFLENLSPLYELISFTTATSIYAEKILNEIETKKKYFSYKFYREHSIIKGKEIVKDISRIGRSMKKILIIDNNANNFKINKENGILIYPFYNEKNKDCSLLELELKKILIKIYNKNYEDIRDGIKEFKNEIIMKVSCGINS